MLANLRSADAEQRLLNRNAATLLPVPWPAFLPAPGRALELNVAPASIADPAAGSARPRWQPRRVVPALLQGRGQGVQLLDDLLTEEGERQRIRAQWAAANGRLVARAPEGAVAPWLVRPALSDIRRAVRTPAGEAPPWLVRAAGNGSPRLAVRATGSAAAPGPLHAPGGAALGPVQAAAGAASGPAMQSRWLANTTALGILDGGDEGLGLLDDLLAADGERQDRRAAEAAATHATAWAGHIRSTSTQMHQGHQAWTAGLHAAELRVAAALERAAQAVRQELGDVWQYSRAHTSLFRGRRLALEMLEARRLQPASAEHRAAAEMAGGVPAASSGSSWPLERRVLTLRQRLTQAADRFPATIAALRRRITRDDAERAYSHAARIMSASGPASSDRERADRALRAAAAFDALPNTGPGAAQVLGTQAGYLAVAVQRAGRLREQTATRQQARGVLQAATRSADPAVRRTAFGELSAHQADQGYFVTARGALREYDALAKAAPEVAALRPGLRAEITKGTRIEAAARVYTRSQGPIERTYLEGGATAAHVAAASYGALADRLSKGHPSGSYALRARVRQGNFLLVQAHEEALLGNLGTAVTLAARATHELGRAARSRDANVAAVASYLALQLKLDVVSWDPARRRGHLRTAGQMASRLRPALVGVGAAEVRVSEGDIERLRECLGALVPQPRGVAVGSPGARTGAARQGSTIGRNDAAAELA